jgi:cardiolipin synthase
MKPLPYVNAANLISLTRLLMLPVYFYFLIYYLRWRQGDDVSGVTMFYYLMTLGLVPVILATDILDGWVARQFDLVNPLGAFLDPLADKLFVILTLVTLAWVDELPLWLVMLVFFKEVFILTGWVLLFILGYDTEIAPTRIGKGAVICQGTLIFSALLTLPGGELLNWDSFPLHEIAEMVNRLWFQIFTGFMIALSGLQYILEGLRRSQRIEAGNATLSVLDLEPQRERGNADSQG